MITHFILFTYIMKNISKSKNNKSTKKNKTVKKGKGFKKGKTKKQKTRENTRKNAKIKVIKNTTPLWLNNLGKGENMEGDKLGSYSPTINQELITLISGATRAKVNACNNKKAFLNNEPLQISVNEHFLFGNKCVPYYTKEAKQILLANLAANKHVVPSKIIPPKQLSANCWFNAMFMTFFISDKGRKFFRFFRQLMIEGRQINGKEIPIKLRNAFALLNFAVDSALTGSKYAITMDTNNIIRQIYDAIPKSYIKSTNRSIPYLNDAGNPILYYNAIINYLGNHSIKMYFENDFQHLKKWKNFFTDKFDSTFSKGGSLPHIIVVEIHDDYAAKVKNKPLKIELGKLEYVLDSAVVRDIKKQHFCAMVTCEGVQMAFDGYSYHRLSASNWKDKINSSEQWEFEGTENEDGTPMKWSFLISYQLLFYYRVS